MPIIQRHQTLLDFATQYTGSAEGLMQVANLNGIGITDSVTPGTELLAGPVIDVKFSYSQTGKHIATGGRANELVILEGIGYWNVGLNFKTS